jgi:hypothetical protein
VARRLADAAVTDDVWALRVQAVSPRPITARQKTTRVPDTEQQTLGSRTRAGTMSLAPVALAV